MPHAHSYPEAVVDAEPQRGKVLILVHEDAVRVDLARVRFPEDHRVLPLREHVLGGRRGE